MSRPAALVRCTIALCALANAASHAQGFDCAPLIPSSNRTPPYGPSGGPGQCEGFFEKTVSQPFVELLSLTRGEGPRATDMPGGALELQAASPRPLRLIVQPLRSRPYYRVDLQLAAGASRRWDPAGMLAATGLRLGDLGFLANADPAGATGAASGEPAAFAPVAVRTADRSATTAQAILRVSVPVASLAWRSYPVGAATASPAQWNTLADSRLLQWQRLALPIALPATEHPLRIDVEAIDAKDGRALPQLHFLVVGGALDGPAK